MQEGEADGQGDDGDEGEGNQGGGGGEGGLAAAPAPEAAGGADGAGVDGFAGVEAAQVRGEGGGAGVAAGRVFFQAAQADGVEVARHAGLQAARRHRLLAEDLAERLQRRVAQERRPAGETFVQDGPQRVHVGGRPHVAVLAGGLFGRHVAGRAEHRPGARQVRGAGQVLGEAEVGHLWLVSGEW
jgi:hypothetical protein